MAGAGGERGGAGVRYASAVGFRRSSTRRPAVLDLTPQERLALTVLALLLGSGAIARHAVYRADLGNGLAVTADAADTLHAGLQARAEAELERERARREPLAPGERLDPNQATVDELDRLPRIGPALAERIVSHRARDGPFRTVQDLRRVPGIGDAVLRGITPHLALPESAPGGTRGGGSGTPVDINSASTAELERLPGIGPALAGRIVEYRRANGPFRNFDDLEKVSGIGPSLRSRLEGLARLGT